MVFNIHKQLHRWHIQFIYHMRYIIQPLHLSTPQTSDKQSIHFLILTCNIVGLVVCRGKRRPYGLNICIMKKLHIQHPQIDIPVTYPVHLPHDKCYIIPLYTRQLQDNLINGPAIFLVQTWNTVRLLVWQYQRRPYQLKYMHYCFITWIQIGSIQREWKCIYFSRVPMPRCAGISIITTPHSGSFFLIIHWSSTQKPITYGKCSISITPPNQNSPSHISCSKNSLSWVECHNCDIFCMM